MIPDNFLSAVRDGKYHFFGNVIDVKKYSWYDMLALYKNHPDDLTKMIAGKGRIELNALHTRGSAPTFAKTIWEDLKNTFPRNQITNIAFMGPDLIHSSYPIHADVMDVLYLQVVGSIEWSIYKPIDDKKQKDLLPQEATEVFRTKMIPGDLIWIPRGIHHHIQPLSGRVGFSFGVEGPPTMT
jgi:hypothetical protein